MVKFRLAVWLDGKSYYGGNICSTNWRTADLIATKIQNSLQKDGYNVKVEVEDFYENQPSIIMNHNNKKLSYYIKFYTLPYKEETEEHEIQQMISFFRDIEDYEKCAYLKQKFFI